MPNNVVVDLTDSYNSADGSVTDEDAAIIVLDDSTGDPNASDCELMDEAAAVIEILDTDTESDASPRALPITEASKAKEISLLCPFRNEHRHDHSHECSPPIINTGHCPICLTKFGTHPMVSTICGHVFCKQCLMQALSFEKICPICRLPLLELNSFHSIFM